jgi:Protein kinase domain
LLPLGRAHIARQIAKGVMALHARDVIHCDIAPRNIIVNSRLDATLIDFGLARRTDHATQTRLAPDPFKAPEQCGEPPLADKASDVYALGVLLRGYTMKSDLPSAELRTLAEKMTAQRAEDRPSIGDVVQQLDDLVDFEPMLHQLRSQIEDVVNDAPEWLWEDLLHFSGAATLVHGRYLPWDTQRAMEVAFQLNNLFVRAVAEKRGTIASKLAACSEGEELSLASIRRRVRDNADKTMREWGCPEVKAVGLMRIAWAHPSDRKARISDAMRELKSHEATFQNDIREAVSTVARMLDQLADSSSGAISRFMEFYTKGT